MDLEFANSRTEVAPSSKDLESRTRGVETFEWQLVTLPANFDTLVLQGEEDDQGGKGNTARECGGGNANVKWFRHRITRTFE